MPVRDSIRQNRRKWKIKVVARRKMAREMTGRISSDDLDVSIAMIQALIPCGLDAVKEKLYQEVERLAGKRYRHGKENVRWTRQGGSVYLRDQKIPIEVPRVRNKARNEEVPLETYQRLQRPYLADRQTMLKLLNGISTRKYQESAELVPEVFGISPSNLSKRFKKNTTEALRKLKTRSLAPYDFVCVFIDGKRYAKDGLLIAMGVTIEGRKVILDIEQSHTENAIAAGQLLERLKERGLRFEEGLLFIVDGSKGFINAIKAQFREYAFIQRCRQHKQENVVSYLSKSQQELCRRMLKDAYAQTTYSEAESAIDTLHRELLNVNQSAANSLMEGVDEILTLHRLGLSPELQKSLGSTNCIESVMSQLGQYTDKVDRWHNSGQILRWTAAGLIELEPRLNRIKGYRYLPLLRHKMLSEIKVRQEKMYGAVKEPETLEAVEA